VEPGVERTGELRIGVIDVTPDAVRLLVVESRPPDLFGGGGYDWLDRRVTVTTAAAGRNGDVLGRTIAVLAGYAEALRAWAVDRAVTVMSEAMADLPGGEVLPDRAFSALGMRPSVLSRGERDALAFAGAVGRLEGPLPYLVVDAAADTTRFLLGKHRPDSVTVVGFGAGSVFGEAPSVPLGRGVLAVARGETRSALDVDLWEPPGTLVGAGPAFTALATVAMGLPAFDPAVVHGSVLSLETVTALASLLVEMGAADLAALPVVDRLDGPAVAGAAVLAEQVMRRRGVVEAVVSAGDVLDGIIDDVLASPPGPPGPRRP
jgi:exopolyphosphatase / guanosine-5'-triphosphate,3'-diphosphate pyrophosphatase